MGDNVLDIIPIEKEETILCERYYYEYEGTKILINQFTNINEFPVDNEKYRILLAEYIEAYAAYMMYMRFLRNKYLKPEHKSDTNIDFMVEFDFDEIVVMKKNNGGACSCQLN